MTVTGFEALSKDDLVRLLTSLLDRQAPEQETAVTVAEYLDKILPTFTAYQNESYLRHWTLLATKYGTTPVGKITGTDVRVVVKMALESAKRGRSWQGGYSAQQKCVTAMRMFFARAMADQLCNRNPADGIDKLRTRKDARWGLKDEQVAELDRVCRTGRFDPLLDTLLLRFHLETACRRGGALNLRVIDLDPERQLVHLFEKGEKWRWQPVSRVLMNSLLDHLAVRRPNALPHDPVFWHRPERYRLPVAKARYDKIAYRWQRELPWAAEYGVSMHWMRHTTLTRLERAGITESVRFAFAGHTSGKISVVYTKSRELEEVCTAFAQTFGVDHPLAR